MHLLLSEQYIDSVMHGAMIKMYNSTVSVTHLLSRLCCSSTTLCFTVIHTIFELLEGDRVRIRAPRPLRAK